MTRLGTLAYLFQRMYVIVRQRELSYTHRDLPFRRVVIKTKVTPNLDDPASLPAACWARRPSGRG
jgi:hypothetical protein